MRALAGVAILFTAALLVSETAMQPSSADRLQLVAVFGGVALLAVVVAVALRNWSPRSLRTAVIGVTLTALGIAGLAVVVSATSMFLSSHDLKLVLVALGLGMTLGVVVSIAVTGDVLRDVTAIRETAGAVAAGDRDVRTGVMRRDEIGELAATLDTAIAQLAAAEEERQETDAARRHFLASVGHDLRTPLTSLRTAIEALQDGIAQEPERYLVAMHHDVELLSSLVDDLFLLARIESGGLQLDLQPFDLGELADGVIEAVRPSVEQRDVRVVLRRSGAVPVVADPRELSRVLRNLLDNAVRHAPDGSTVEVRLDDTEGPTVSILDEGPGFDAEFVDVAFERFTRADEARVRDGSGAGLGLAIARGLVEAHGGRITARPGPGGEVNVRLPARSPTSTSTT